MSRVLFVNAGLALGGAEHSLLLLLDGLRAANVDVIVGLFDHGPFEARLTARGISTVMLPVGATLRATTRYGEAASPLARTARVVMGVAAAVRIARLARRLRVDLLHTNGLKPHLLGGVAGRLASIPVVWHLRDYPPPGLNGCLVRAAARRLPALVIANSNSVAASVPGARVRSIHNPVDLEAFSPTVSGKTVRAELGLGEGVPLVGMVAHLTPWKGHEQFLSIARDVVRAVPDARFVVVGGPIYETAGHRGYEDSLRAQTTRLGLDGVVTFQGARDDVPDILAALDVLVHCPIAPEPFGRVLAEAMAVGRAVVAPRWGGIPEIVEHDKTGILVPPGDVPAFVRAIVGLLATPGLRSMLGDAGRRHVERVFSPAAHTAAVLDAYRAVLAPAR